MLKKPGMTGIDSVQGDVAGHDGLGHLVDRDQDEGEQEVGSVLLHAPTAWTAFSQRAQKVG